MASSSLGFGAAAFFAPALRPLTLVFLRRTGKTGLSAPDMVPKREREREKERERGWPIKAERRNEKKKNKKKEKRREEKRKNERRRGSGEEEETEKEEEESAFFFKRKNLFCSKRDVAVGIIYSERKPTT
ncbi:MAG: hypothetical protein Q8P67_27165 [archaeon]|nr:hypothetical protein [archaeon]